MSIIDSLRIPDAPPLLADLEYRVGKLSLGPSDVLVLKLDVPLTATIAERIRDELRRRLPADTLTLILDAHAELSVLTRAEIEARTA